MESHDELSEIYAWIDTIPFSRPKKNINRDFSDAIPMAELLKRYYPRYIELHNYSAGNSLTKKIDNWNLLNQKVLPRIGLKLKKETILRLAKSEPGVIEQILINLRNRIIKDCNVDSDSVYFSNDEDKGIDSILDANEQLMKKPVSRQCYLRLKNQLEEKERRISELQDKVISLENTIFHREQQILELENRYHQLVGLNIH